MTRYFNIDLDGNNGYEHWADYPVCEVSGYTEKGMFEDVRLGLKELGGGHADIWDENDELYAEIEW